MPCTSTHRQENKTKKLRHYTRRSFLFVNYLFHRKVLVGFLWCGSLCFCPVVAVDHMVHHRGKDKRTADIKEGVLLDKHGCQNDAYGQQKGKQTYGPVFFELLVFHDCQTDAERIIHMDTRKQVGRCVSGVELLAEHRADIVVRKIRRAQVLSVRIYRGDDQEDRHACKQKRTQLIVIGFVM